MPSHPRTAGEVAAVDRTEARVLGRLLRAAIIVALLATGGHAWAADRRVTPVQAQGLAASCMDDYLRLCNGVPPRRGRVIMCLNLQADQLSQRCFQALTARGLQFAAALKACAPDFERFCGGAPMNMRRTLICLQQNADQLSRPCKQALTDDDDFNDAPPGGAMRPR